MPRALSNALPPLLSALFSTRENHSRRQPHRSCTHRPTPASSFQASPFFPPSLNKHRIKVETVFGEERRLPFASKIFEDFLRFEKFAFTISCSRSPGRIFSSHENHRFLESCLFHNHDVNSRNEAREAREFSPTTTCHPLNRPQRRIEFSESGTRRPRASTQLQQPR